MHIPINLLVFDLDRTLLANDKNLSPYTLSVLHRCRDRGIRIAFATARSEKSTARFTKAVQPDALILNGGALVTCGDTTIYNQPMEKNIANSLIQSCLQTVGVGYITAETQSKYLVSHPVDPSHPSWQDYEHAIHTDFSTPLEESAYKITVQFDNHHSAMQVASLHPQVSMLAFAGETWYRFAHPEATKWLGVCAAAQSLNIPLKSIAAFGDESIDIEMIQNAGIGVAVENAMDEVRAAADFICPSNENCGPARWIEQNVLNEGR